MIRQLMVFALAIGIGGPGNAATLLHGFSFDDNAFADEVRSDLTGFTVIGAATAEEALIGADTSSFAFNAADNTFVTLGFLDNLIVNGPGMDLVVFELNVLDAEPIVLRANGISSAPQAQTDTGDLFLPDGRIEYTSWDLSDFGVPLGGTVDGITISGICTAMLVPVYGCTEGADVASAFLAVGALNSVPALAAVPLPASLPMLLGAVLMLGAYRRKLTSKRV